MNIYKEEMIKADELKEFEDMQEEKHEDSLDIEEQLEEMVDNEIKTIREED